MVRYVAVLCARVRSWLLRCVSTLLIDVNHFCNSGHCFCAAAVLVPGIVRCVYWFVHTLTSLCGVGLDRRVLLSPSRHLCCVV